MCQRFWMCTLVAPDGRVARQQHQTFGTVTDEREAYQRSTWTREAPHSLTAAHWLLFGDSRINSLKSAL